MATERFSNVAESTVNDDPLLIGGTTLNVPTGHGARFASPTGGDFQKLFLMASKVGGATIEVVHATARTDDALTIARGQDGTSAAEWPLGTLVIAAPSAATLAALRATTDAFDFTGQADGDFLRRESGLWVPRTTAEVRADIGGTAVATALPASPVEGQTVILRLGTTPYEYVRMTFDAALNKWVSDELRTHTGGENGLLATTTALDGNGAEDQFWLGMYGLYYAAGLRPQGRMVGRYQNTDSSGTVTARMKIRTGALDVNAITDRGTTAGKTSTDSWTNSRSFDTGWQDFSNADPTTDVLALVVARVERGIAGTAQLFARNMMLRFVAAPT